MAEDAKDKFEKEKETILKSLPDKVKAMFGVIGFCKVDVDDEEEDANPNAPDDYVPCIILDPYQVPPRPFRDVYWWDKYSISKKAKRLEKLEYIVYHYGADEDDCYGFIDQEEFKSYEDGVAEGYDKLPEHIQAKVDRGEELTEEEGMRVRGLEEMREDIAKAVEDRRRGTWQFQERHEVLAEKAAVPSTKKRQRD